MISNSVITAMLVEGLFCTLLPFALLILWVRKTRAKVKPFFIGAATFILFALVLEQILHYFCLIAVNPVSTAINGSVVLMTLYGGLAAGIFEETGRLVAFKLMKKHTDRKTAITYGIGHGGIEAILLVGMNMTLYAVYAMMINRNGADAFAAQIGDAEAAGILVHSLQAMNPLVCLYGAWERVSAIILHISLSVLVFRAVHTPGKKYLYPVAILLHAGLDFIAVLYQQGILTSLLLTEILVSAFVVLVAIFAWKVYHQMPETTKGEEQQC